MGMSEVALSGDPEIDGVLWGVKWDASGLTYAFPASTSDYSGYPLAGISGFSTFGAVQIAAVNTIMAELSGLIVTGIASGTGATANLRFAEADFVDQDGFGNPGIIDTAVGTPPDDTFVGAYAHGDMLFNHLDFEAPVRGDYAFLTIMHELGHALGLKHGHEEQFHPNGFTLIPALPAAHDGMEYSLMTYRSAIGGSVTGAFTNEEYGFAQSFMMNDIAALQYLYGADFTTNSGNTTYTFSSLTGEMFVNGAGLGAPGANRIFRTVWDGGGTDTYSFANYTTNLVVDLDPGAFSLLADAQRAVLDIATTIKAQGNLYNARLYQGDLRSLIENAYGGTGNDSLSGNVGANVLLGGSGNDQLLGKGGVDSLYGGSGDDLLRGGDAAANTGDSGDSWLGGDAGNDTLYGGIGSDRLDGGADTDTLYGEAGADFITGGDGNDTIYGGDGSVDTGDLADSWLGGDAGSDTIFGGTGNDRIDGGADNDTLHGGVDQDIVTGGTGDDILFGGAGNDSLLSGEAGNDVINGDAGNDAIYGGSGNDTLNGGDQNDYLYGGDGNDNLSGGAGNDVWLGGDAGDDSLAGDAGNDRLDGGLGNDILDGGTDVDYVTGGSGNDTIDGGSGSDSWLSGEANDDSVSGGDGNDRIDGGDGHDALQGNADVDYITGGLGNDTLFGGDGGDAWLAGESGDDIVSGDAGNDRIDGGTGNDQLFGNDGVDFITSGSGDDLAGGGSGNDTWLAGDSGNDQLFGGDGNDRMDGGADNDRLTGDSGNDALTGGSGSDIFVFYDDASNGFDLIGDWSSGSDLMEVDASAFGGGLSAGGLTVDQLVLSATPAATQAFGQFLFETDLGRLYWDADGTGAGAALLIAELWLPTWSTRATTLTVADFIVVA
jgi:serralysin